VSRRVFRGVVSAPRPTSAWVLVIVASATLWITGELDAATVAAQAAAIGFSFLRRARPYAWQQSPLALNVGMFGIVGQTIAVALRGEPSTLALAHFAALTQGLQLIDSRPRTTEYLLVALALFQVILASNLTDSVFFPPLLIAFLLATVWTLLVHTLRSEAIEAGDPGAVTRAITPGLLHTTLVASGLAVVLALALFVTLPRLRSNMVAGSGIAPAFAAAGFSSRVQLGDIGRIREDPKIALRVETLQGSAPPAADRYWRGLAFDHFDGRAWSITPPGRFPVAGSPEGGVGFGPRPKVVNLLERIVREPVEAGVLFASGDPRQLQGTVRRVERDSSGGLYAAGQADERIRYTVATYLHRWRDEDLRRDRSAVPFRSGTRYLDLPRVAPRLSELAREITVGASNDADRVRAIERHLIEKGRYSRDPPRLDPALGSPVEAFLGGELAGHCEYFASGMVLLARSIGIPARLVNGFAGGRENGVGGFIEVRRSDAHSWVEVHYGRAGWVAYDPTPADLRAIASASLSLSERAAEFASALELWWYQRVVGFDRSDQISALRRGWLAWQGSDAEEAPAERDPARAWSGIGPSVSGWMQPLLLLAVLVGVGMLVRRWRRPSARSGVPRTYLAALRALSRRGLVREAGTTARAFAQRVTSERPGAAALAFATLTESYLQERFGGLPPRAGVDELRELRRSLRRSRARGRVSR
jgi:transglutaminase-like putative cysteine protease